MTHDAIVAALRALPGRADNPGWMRRAFAHAADAGLDGIACDTPAEAHAMMRRMAAAGRADLPFGRLFEGHVNARMLLAAYGGSAPAGAILGVWNSDQPGAPLRLQDGHLHGAKNFASGAGIVTHPLVTLDANDPRATRMLLIDAGKAKLAIDREWWNPVGMLRSDTHIVHFDGTAVAGHQTFGAPGNYQRQPGFSAGALRFVAVQAGGVHALFDHVRDHLCATDRTGHPHQKHRLARLFGLADAGYALIDRTAAAWDVVDPTRIIPLVAAARAGIEAIATEALAIAQAAVGVQGMMRDHPLSAVLTDLAVYLRQPNPDGARDAAGEAAAAGTIVPGR
jgi:hypothetical protein